MKAKQEGKISYNTLIKYTRIPDEDDLSLHDSECNLLSNDPVIIYNTQTKTLMIEGKDVHLEIKARKISIESNFR